MNGFRLILLAAIVVAGAASLSAQTTGDFRSHQNGNWNDVNSWEQYNGSSWVNPAPAKPQATDGAVTILSGDTITVTAKDSIDQLVVDGVLSVNDTLLIVDGTGTDAVVNGSVIMVNAAGRMSLSVVGTPDISFAGSSFYIHTVNGGSIPTATWGTGSTCLITGVTANAPANGNQNFYNVTWNCPGQTGNYNLGWNGITIGGTITVVSTGSGRWQMCAPTSGNSATVTIDGDIIQTGGNFTTNGTGSGNTTIVINQTGNINVTGGNFSVSRGSQGGTGTTTWNLLAGDFTMSNATTQNSNPTGAKFVFARTDTQTISFSGVTVQSGFNFDVDTSTTLIVGDVGDTLNVTGTLVNRGTIVPSGPLGFANGAIYRHARNGGIIPFVTWATGSTCEVTGVISSSPANTAQNFYNFTWNCPGQTANLNVGWQTGVTISGTLTVTSTNWNHASTSSPASQLRMFGAAGSCTINNIVVNGYGAVLTAQGSGFADTVYVNGNITLSAGGMLSFSNNSGGVTTYIVKGNFTVVDSAYIGKSNSANLSKLVFSKQGIQNYAIPVTGVTYFGAPNATVASGSSLNMGTSVFGGAGSFEVQAGALLESAHPAGLNGNIASTGANGGGNSLSTGADYKFSAIEPQVTGSILPSSLARLIVNDTAGVTLTQDVAADTLELQWGRLLLGSKNIVANGVIGGFLTDYVQTDSSGTLTINKTTGQTLFPVGTAVAYSPVVVENLWRSDTVSAAVVSDPTPAPAGGRVNLRWSLTGKVTGGGNYFVQFGWLASQEDAAFAADRNANARVYSLADTSEVGSGIYHTNFSAQPYTLGRDSIRVLGVFAVGAFKSGATSVQEDAAALPKEFTLHQNYPNPFNPSTTIKYDIPTASHVTIAVYDILGRMVAELVNGDRAPGWYTAEWNAGNFTSGVYYCRITAGDFVSVKKLLLVK